MNKIIPFVLKYQHLFILLLLFSFLEQFYLLFSFVERSVFSAISLILSFSLSLVILKHSKFTYSNLFFCLTVLFFIFLEGANNFSLTSGFSWIGTMLKLSVFTILYFTLQGRKLSLVDKLNMFRNLVIITNIVLLSTTILGLLFNNFNVLNGRTRFLALSHTSSLVACFSGFSVIMNFYYVKYYKKVYSRTLYLFSFFSLYLGLIILLIAGSRQPVLGIAIPIILLIIQKNKAWFVSILLGCVLTLYLVHIEFITGIDFLVSFHQFIHVNLNIAFDMIDYGFLSYMDGSSLSRFKYFEVGLEYVNNNNFIFGAGLNSFPYIYMAETGLEAPAPHNLVLSVVTQFGYLGFVLLMLFIIKNVFLSLKYKKEEHIIMYLYIGFGLSLNNPEYFLSLVIPLIFYFKLISTFKNLV